MHFPLPHADASQGHPVGMKVATEDPAIFTLDISLLEIGNHILQIRLGFNGTYKPMDTSPVILKVSNVISHKSFRRMQNLCWERLSIISHPLLSQVQPLVCIGPNVIANYETIACECSTGYNMVSPPPPPPPPPALLHHSDLPEG